MLIGEAVSREGKVLHVVRRRRRGKEIPVLEADGLETGLRPNVGTGLEKSLKRVDSRRIGTGMMNMYITDSRCQNNGERFFFMVENDGGLFLFALLHYKNSNVRKQNTFEKIDCKEMCR